jgi:hypothetical protein
VPGPPLAGLAHARVQAEIGDQLVGAGEALDGADRGQQPDRDHHVDARHRHEPFHVGVGQRVAGEFALHRTQVLAEAVVLAQVPRHRLCLIRRQGLRQQPGPALGTEQVGVRAGRHEMRVQDGLDDRLQPRALAHDLVASRNLSAQCEGPLTWHPDLRKEVAGVEPRQHGCVDRVGLDAGFRDQPHLARVGDHHPPDMRGQQFADRRGVAGCFDHDMVVMRQPARERLQVLTGHADPAEASDLASVEHHRLGKHAVDVQAYHSHCLVCSSRRCKGSRRATRQLRIRARSAPGRAAGAAR